MPFIFIIFSASRNNVIYSVRVLRESKGNHRHQTAGFILFCRLLTISTYLVSPFLKLITSHLVIDNVLNDNIFIFCCMVFLIECEYISIEF